MRRVVLPIGGIAIGCALLVAALVVARPPVPPMRVDEVNVSAVSTTTPTTTSQPAPSPGPTATPKLGDGWRIRIARVGIDIPLREGDVARDIALQRTPDGAAYRLPGTAIPGSGGNTYLYGHARWAQFIGLWYAHLDDLVVVSGPGVTLRYRVAEIHPRVANDDLTYQLPSSSERLTLQTSTGPNPEDPRFIVVAVPTEP